MHYFILQVLWRLLSALPLSAIFHSWAPEVCLLIVTQIMRLKEAAAGEIQGLLSGRKTGDQLSLISK